MLNVDDGRARWPNRAGRARSRGTGEGHGAKVGKGDERAARLKVLDDPLGIQLLQRLALAGEGVGDRGALGVVLDDGCAAGRGSGRDGDGDAVASRNRDAREVVSADKVSYFCRCRWSCPWIHLRVVWVPLVPGVEANGRALDVEVDTRLEDRVAGGVAIDADPGRSGVLIR